MNLVVGYIYRRQTEKKKKSWMEELLDLLGLGP
jgi:hypothetical protein